MTERWQLDIPPPLMKRANCQEVVDLIEMPIGASKFFAASSDQVGTWMQRAAVKMRGRGKLSRRFAEEKGVRGYRVWKLASLSGGAG